MRVDIVGRGLLLLSTLVAMFAMLLFAGGIADTAARKDAQTPFLVATPSDTAHFAVIGDYGAAAENGQAAEEAVANLVKSWNPELIITLGDNNYPSGMSSTIDLNIGQFYHEFIYPYGGSYGQGSTFNRFWPALGNHDWYNPDLVDTNANPYLQYFALPNNERYYDFVSGPVHFFSLDSDSHEPDGITSNSVQGSWLQARLAASTSPWKLVYFHHPPYSSGSTHGNNTALQWPFREWGASAVLAGHEHNYERIVLSGFPYFVNGLGGRARYGFGAPVPGSEVRYNADWGAQQVDATMDSITFRFYSRAGTLVDTYTLNAGGGTATPTSSPTSTSTATPSPTETVEPSTPTSTPTSTSTTTSSPTSTATPSPTETVEPPSSTSTSTSTSTATATTMTTSTATTAATSTSTPIPTITSTETSTGTATPTNTVTASPTNSATNTPMLPTSTSVRTSTPAATETSISTPTHTPTRTATNTHTASPISSVTPTPIPTSTSTSTSTSTVISTRTAQPPPSLTPSSTSTTLPTLTPLGTATATPSITPAPTQATPTLCPVRFSDVPTGNTFYANIRCLSCKGILGGYSDGTFRPNNPVTRGQLSKIVANAAGFGEPVRGQHFSDVPIGSTFYEYVERMAERGIIGGYSDDTFRPNTLATRGQISKIVANAANLNDPVSGQRFSDVLPGSTFYEYIERLAARGVMGGYSDGTFRPDNNATRGQTSKIAANTFFPNCPTP